MPRSRALLLALAALALGLARPPASAADLPGAVTHGTADVYFASYGRCSSSFTWALSGTFLVGPKTWHGDVSASTCFESGVGSEVVLPFQGASPDGQLTSSCVSNLAADPFLQGRGAGRGALVCLMSVDGGQKYPVVMEMQTHAFYDTTEGSYRHSRTGTFYGA